MWIFLKVAPRSLKMGFPKRWKSSTNLSYLHHIGKEPLKFISFGKLLETTANKYPNREVLVSRHQNQRLTYMELLQQADKLAAGLRAIGVDYGDRVGLWAPNMAEWHVVNIACARAGFIVVALNPAYEAPEMEYCINKVGMKTIICPDKIKRLHFYDILNQVYSLEKSEPGKVNHQSLKNVITISDKTLKGTYNYNEIIGLANDHSISDIKNNQHLVRPDDPLNIQFTSGTTGKPKAAVLSHFNVVNNSNRVGYRIELSLKHHTICVQVPFFHAFGYTNTFGAAINHGATMVIPSPIYSPLKNLKAIQEEKCTIVNGTPTMFVDLVSVQKQEKLNINPEIAVSGGAPCSPQLFKQMKEMLGVKKVKSVFGLTETTAVVFHSLPVDEDEYKSTGTVGHLGDHLEAKVVDDNDNIVPMGTPGELCIRGYCTMLGYWKDEEKTKEMIGNDMWLRTGDQFVLQEDGYGRIVGRLKDMINRGGENIFPKEIEDLLNTHPDILETHVVGLDHERLGEEVCACVRLKEGSKLALEDIVDFCKGEIAYFKIPSQLRIVNSFPKTQSGKIQKYLLKAQFEK